MAYTTCISTTMVGGCKFNKFGSGYIVEQTLRLQPPYPSPFEILSPSGTTGSSLSASTLWFEPFLQAEALNAFTKLFGSISGGSKVTWNAPGNRTDVWWKHRVVVDGKKNASLGRKMCPAGLKHHRRIIGGWRLVSDEVKKEMWPIAS
ncbi:hypothetical protein L195_g010683 [Trifolium pratense]|uniref:Uncharacterized protein n=1 Tax=Trifolium pratense TaxID=57577 RepID=A0A2K3PFK6_TRIPR|nr:hypothetical protein L195_g010683 [Trifolium pratense]